MKGRLCGVLLALLTALTPALQAQTSAINGTWSGNWTPKGGVPDAITVELRQEGAGAVSGKFVNPAQMEFSKATFNAKTGALLIHTKDDKSGKPYKLEGKVEGNEIKGTLTAGDSTGEVRLIKWTFFGR
jgi:hypothetical protein